MKSKVFVLTILVISLTALVVTGAETITIASFNIQVFGQTKAGKAEVMAKLAQIITRYDVVAIQEIRDAKGTAIEELERVIDAQRTDYEYLIGPRLGRTASKENMLTCTRLGPLRREHPTRIATQPIFFIGNPLLPIGLTQHS